MQRVGIIGAGGMGNVHARQYRKMSDVELFVHDRDESRVSEFVARWDASACDSIESLIAATDIIDVCLPTDVHLETALKAIAAGRAVFVEKPITRTLEEARELRDAASKAGVPVMPGQVVRYFPEFATANRLVRAGKIGTPAAARTRRGGKAPGGSQGWFLDHARSGGVLLDLAIHDFDFLRWTLGEVKFLFSRSVAADTGVGPDYALTTLTFDGGAVAHVESTWMDPSGFRTHFEIAGSDGLIQHDSRNNVAVRTVSSTNATTSTFAETPAGELDDPYYQELKAFLDAVKSSTTPPVTAEDGLRALAISLAAIESAKTRKVVVPARE